MGKIWDFFMRRKSLLLTFLLFFSTSFFIGRQVFALFANAPEPAEPESEPVLSTDPTEYPLPYHITVASPRDVTLLDPIEVPHTGALVPQPVELNLNHNNFGDGANLNNEATRLVNPESSAVAEILASQTSLPHAFFAVLNTLVACALFLVIYSFVMHFLR